MCRSPLAAALVRHKVTFAPPTTFSTAIQVKSAGTSADSGLPMSLAPDIEDPHGCDLDSYRQCAQEIETAWDALVNRLRAAQNQVIQDE